MLVCVSLSEKHKPPVGHCKIIGAPFIYLWVHLFIQQTRKKAYNILEDRTQLLRSPESISKVKCTANRFRASLESGAIWLVSSMINEKSGPILGLIDCVSHPLVMEFLVLCTTSVDSRSYLTDLTIRNYTICVVYVTVVAFLFSLVAVKQTGFFIHFPCVCTYLKISPCSLFLHFTAHISFCVLFLLTNSNIKCCVSCKTNIPMEIHKAT